MSTDSVAAETFKYDIAISFLSQDEDRASEIHRLLEERLRVFIYTREQEQIAGRDGEKVLADVFGQDSRVVVVLHRAEWGSTPFTRVEETAIRNRAYEDGYDFVVLCR